MPMYTGHRIIENQIYRQDTRTQYSLNDDHIHVSPDQPTGYYLMEGLSPEAKHIYGPDGYTKFYVQNGHIYGPSTQLPWLAARVGCKNIKLL